MLQKLIDELNDRKKMYSPIHHAAMNDCISLLTKALPDFEEAIKKAWLAGSAPNHMTQEQVNRILAVELDGCAPMKQEGYFKKECYCLSDKDLNYTTDWNDFHRVFRKYVVSGGFLMKFHELLLLETPLQAATRLSQIITDAAIH